MKRNLMLLAVAVFAVPLLVWAAAPRSDRADDPVKVGPDVYKVVMENERVRLLEVTFEPGKSIAMHSHPDHAAYVLEGNKLEITPQGKEPVELALEVGKAFWIPAESHSARNTGDTRVRVLVVELNETAPTAGGLQGKAMDK